jgi:hypothetical protein
MLGFSAISQAPISSLVDTTTSNTVDTSLSNGAFINGWVLNGYPINSNVYTGWGGFAGGWAEGAGVFTLTIPLGGAAYSESSVSPNLTPTVNCVPYPIAAQTTVSGDLQHTVPLAGSISSSTVVTGSVEKQANLNATLSVVSSGSGLTKSTIPLGVLAQGVATGAGTFRLTIPIAGSGQSVAAVAPLLTPQKNLVSSIAVASTATGALSKVDTLGAAPVVVSTCTAALKQTTPMAGTGASTVTQNVTLNINKQFASTIACVTTIPASPIEVDKVLIAPLQVVSTGSGSIKQTTPVAGAAFGEVSAPTDLKLVKPIAGSSSSVATSTPTLRVDVVITATVFTVVTTSAALSMTEKLEGVAGTGAISNIANANLRLVNTLGGSLTSSTEILDSYLTSVHLVFYESILGGSTFDATADYIFADAVLLDGVPDINHTEIVLTAAVLDAEAITASTGVYADVGYTQIIPEAKVMDVSFKKAA